MNKTKTYKRTKFPPEVISEALTKLTSFLPEMPSKPSYESYHIRKLDESWSYNNQDEFFAEYRRDIRYARYMNHFSKLKLEITYSSDCSTEVEVEAPERHQIESVFEVFEKNAKNSVIVEIPKHPKSTTIFIGHGRSEQWRDLKDHLHEKHGYDIEAYEIGARAGHTIRDILEQMLESSSFAILVMTGEDKDSEGKLHPRDNVIHELGLFQGSLGFSKVIVLLEEGTEVFSNIHGVHQIRYSRGNIKETFGEVLATLRREFG
jgi:predicted nucleotide-binding protein